MISCLMTNQIKYISNFKISLIRLAYISLTTCLDDYEMCFIMYRMLHATVRKVMLCRIMMVKSQAKSK